MIGSIQASSTLPDVEVKAGVNNLNMYASTQAEVQMGSGRAGAYDGLDTAYVVTVPGMTPTSQSIQDGQITLPVAGPAHHVTDVEMQANRPDEKFFQFSEKAVRLGFIKKVFGLLFFQLLLTAGIICIFIFVEPVRDYVYHHDWVYLTAVLLTLVVTIVFGFATKLRRIWPWNLLGLILTTLVMSVMLGSIAATMEVDEVLISVAIVVVVVAVCALLGFQTKLDFTPLIGFLFMFGTALLAFGFLCIFFYSQVTTVVYCTLGALLFTMWLLFDMQLILGGKHKLQFDPEDYVGGSLTLYVDIVYILIMIFFIFKAT